MHANANNNLSIAIIAGKGQSHNLLYAAAIAHNLKVEIFELHFDCNSVGMCEINKLICILRQNNINKFILTGTFPKFHNIKCARNKNELELLCCVHKKFINFDMFSEGLRAFLEKEGLDFLSQREFISIIKSNAGCLTIKRPTQKDMLEIKKGTLILDSLTHFEHGQELIINNGLILGIEYIGSTIKLIKRCYKTVARLEGEKNCILINNSANHEEISYIDTAIIEVLHKHDIKGIALDLKSSCIINRKAVLDAANALEIFIYIKEQKNINPYMHYVDDDLRIL
ncbi:MAG: UDP-2,3-diacylglucosamine diphosphatase LpxI [Proteobacteria bacterium]|nr:UDP-2,3-diacylglucosamine diphosphatase LpxI [Pseudomonadota bacterium]